MNRKQRKRKLKQKKETVKAVRAQTALIYAEASKHFSEEFSYQSGYDDGLADKQDGLPFGTSSSPDYGYYEDAYNRGYADGYNSKRFSIWPIVSILILILILVGPYLL